jgi:diadenylate cyclase
MLLVYLALSSVVIFQPEIRRILATIGSLLFSDSQDSFDRRRITPELITDAILELSKRKIGALIAFERAISLRGYEESGVMLDALPSRELLLSVFTEPLPLHDGGVTIRNGRIASAHCLFPVSANPKLSGSGMRHRAAVGLSEETDALVIAVSEETRSVSVAHNGRIVRYAANDDDTRSSLLRWVRKAMPEKRSAAEQTTEWFKHRMARFGKGKSK